jgi:hypothetical protein
MKRARTKKSQTNPDILTTSSANDPEAQSHMLTIEELKSFPGFENIDDKEAEKIIKSLYELSLLSYDVLYK